MARKLTIDRSGYYRSDGTHVKATTYQTEDIGSPGRGPKTLPPVKHPGRLTNDARKLRLIKKDQNLSSGLTIAEGMRLAQYEKKKHGAQSARGMFAWPIRIQGKRNPKFRKVMKSAYDSI